MIAKDTRRAGKLADVQRGGREYQWTPCLAFHRNHYKGMKGGGDER